MLAIECGHLSSESCKLTTSIPSDVPETVKLDGDSRDGCGNDGVAILVQLAFMYCLSGSITMGTGGAHSSAIRKTLRHNAAEISVSLTPVGYSVPSSLVSVGCSLLPLSDRAV